MPNLNPSGGPKSETVGSIKLAKPNPNSLTRGFNDYVDILATLPPKTTQVTPSSVPYGTPAEYQRVQEYLRGANISPKYTERQIQEMLGSAKYFIIKSSNQDNINLSRIHKEWATTRSNEVTNWTNTLE